MKTEYQLKKEEFIKKQNERLKELKNNSDYEMSHIEADKILCEILLEYGHEETVNLFSNLNKWYA